MCSETNILWGFSMSVYCKDFFFFYDWQFDLKCERIISASSMQQNVVLRLCWMWQQVHYCIYLAWAAKWSTSPVFAYMIKQVNEATWWNETFLLEWYRRLRPCYEAELFCVKGSFTDYKELDFLKKSRMNGRGYGWSNTGETTSNPIFGMFTWLEIHGRRKQNNCGWVLPQKKKLEYMPFSVVWCLLINGIGRLIGRCCVHYRCPLTSQHYKRRLFKHSSSGAAGKGVVFLTRATRVRVRLMPKSFFSLFTSHITSERHLLSIKNKNEGNNRKV